MSEPAAIRLILVRHGNTFESGQTPTQVGSSTDLPLTAHGRVQAQNIANYFDSNGIKPAAIYAGTLKRQVESAQILGKHFDLEKTVYLKEPSLTEIDYGLWEGLTSEEIALRWPNEYKDWIEKSQWAEGIFKNSLEDHLQLIKKWISELNQLYTAGETVFGLTSNGIMRFFLALQIDHWEKLIRERGLADVKVKTGHFCELLLTNEFVEVKKWNVSPI